MLMEQMACLNFVKRNDDILEENNMLLSQGNSEAWNDWSQNIQKLWSSIKFECFVDQTVEAVINSFSDHFSSGY